MTIMKVWAVLFAFVGIQMAWNLQPFVGDRGRPFQLFRHNERNFYTAIVYSLQKLSHGEGRGAAHAPLATPRQGVRSLLDSSRDAEPDSVRSPGR